MKRAGFWVALRAAIDEAVKPYLSQLATVEHQLLNRATEHAQMLAAIQRIQPASVDLSQEMADDIVRKIHGPLTISQECSDWLRTFSAYKDVFVTYPIGYGSSQGRLDTRVKTDGTLHLQITDGTGTPMWQGTFVPPDYGGS